MRTSNNSFELWCIEFGRLLRPERAARNSYEVLVKGGCEEFKLRSGLYRSCLRMEADPEANTNKAIDRILRCLDSDVERLEELAEDVANARGYQLVWIWTALHRDTDFFLVAGKRILRCKEELSTIRSEFALVATEMKPDLKKLLNNKDPNQYHLCALARYVKSKTGHWYDQRLGELLVVAYSASALPISLTASSFAKKLQRLRKDEPWRFDDVLGPHASS